ncbi:hotdog fold thioesterase [soil metagenome]
MTDSLGAFPELMDLQLGEMTPKRVVATLRVQSKHHQPYGIVHGGVYCAMAETVASIGAVLAIREVTGADDTGAVGQSNHTDFLRATREGTLTATATPVHVGRSVQLWQVDIAGEDDALLATSKVRLFNVGVDRLSG